MRDTQNSPASSQIKQRIQRGIQRLKATQGDPHYVAMGMALGVFVSSTPTIPFHTVIAVALSFVLRASKVTAAIGVWFSNPLTIPVLYFASYKVGTFIFGISSPYDANAQPVWDLLSLGIDITMASIVGGIIIGFIPAITAYLVTRKIVTRMRSNKKGDHKRITTFDPE